MNKRKENFTKERKINKCAQKNAKNWKIFSKNEKITNKTKNFPKFTKKKLKKEKIFSTK